MEGSLAVSFFFGVRLLGKVRGGGAIGGCSPAHSVNMKIKQKMSIYVQQIQFKGTHQEKPIHCVVSTVEPDGVDHDTGLQKTLKRESVSCTTQLGLALDIIQSIPKY